MSPSPPIPNPMTEGQNDLSAMSKLTASGLISIGFCLLGTLFLIWNRFHITPAAFGLLAFGLGGVILAGKPWAPMLGSLFCLFFLLENWSGLEGLDQTERISAFHLHLLLSPIVLVTFLAGIGATVQNYASRSVIRQQPLRMIQLFSLVTALFLIYLFFSGTALPVKPPFLSPP